jgi:hypothetical protein
MLARIPGARSAMQPDLFSYTPPQIMGDRDGATFNRSRDGVRLNDQCQDVYNFMADNCWHTLREAHERTGHPEASISARIRDLRKSRFGGFTIEKRYIENGLWQYRMVDT